MADYVLRCRQKNLLGGPDLPNAAILTDGVRKYVDGYVVVEGFVDGIRVQVKPCLTVRREEEQRCKANIELWTYEEEKKLWNPPTRIMLVEDTPDYHSGKILKKDLVIDDWIDNEDGTIEFSLEGKVIYRVKKTDTVRLML